MSVFQHILAFFIFLIIREKYKAYYENIINERWNDQDEGWLSKVKERIEKAGEGASNLVEKGNNSEIILKDIDESIIDRKEYTYKKQGVDKICQNL